MTNRMCISTAASALVMLTAEISAATINVPADQPTIQAAVTAASAGDTITVATGTYTIGSAIGLPNSGITIQSTNPADPSVVSQTILTGTHGLFVNGSNLGTAADTIEGLTFEGNSQALDSDFDAVIYISNISPVIRNVTFQNWQGAGFYGTDSSPTIEGCTFKNGTFIAVALDGPGYASPGICLTGGSPTITNSTFTGNNNEQGIDLGNAPGGAISLQNPIHAQVQSCVFSTNKAAAGAAIAILGGGGDTTIDGCHFESNTTDSGEETLAPGVGGAIYMGDCTVEVTNCTLTGNMGLQGGGIAASGDDSANPPTPTNLTVSSCTFSGNFAGRNHDQDGSAVYMAYVHGTISQSTFCGNTPTDKQVICTGGDTYCGSNGWGWDGGGNSITDTCAGDADADLIPDAQDNCALPNNDQADCDDNGVGDTCDIADGAQSDCDGNGVPDSCDINSGTHTDCDGNGTPDSCDVAANPDGNDVNGNTQHDRCECMADIEQEISAGEVAIEDLILVIEYYLGEGTPGDTPGDTNWDGIVDIGDVLRVLMEWGECPSS